MLEGWPMTLVSRGVMCVTPCSAPDEFSPATSHHSLECLHWGFDETLHHKQDPGVKGAKCLRQFLAESRHRLLEYVGISGTTLMIPASATLEPQIGFSWKPWTQMAPTYWGSVGFVLGRKACMGVCAGGSGWNSSIRRSLRKAFSHWNLEHTCWAVPRGTGSRWGLSGHCKEMPGFYTLARLGLQCKDNFITSFDSHWTKDLNVNCKTINSIEEDVGGCLWP